MTAKRLNLYFFGQEKINWQDGLYFYGVILIIMSLLFLATITKF